MVVEYLADNNGRKCPQASLKTHETWIGDLNPELKLKDLVLPGVHHHGMVEGSSHYVGSIGGVGSQKVLDWAVTQSLSVTHQLRTGARFLDVRLAEHEGKIYTAHGQEPFINTIGVPFDQLLTEDIAFLKMHKKEFLVWSLRWEFGTPQWKQVEEMLNKHKEHFYTLNVNPMGKQLLDLAGKILICKEGRDRSLVKYRVLPCKGSYDKTQEKDPVELVKKIKEYAKNPLHPKDEIFNFIEAVATTDAAGIVYSTNFLGLNTLTGVANDLKDLGCMTNKVLKEDFLTEENKPRTENFHAVMVDYSVYHNVIPGILELNKFKNQLLVS